MSDSSSPPPIQPSSPDPNSDPSSDPNFSPHTDSSDLLGRGKLEIAQEKTMGMLAHLLGGVTSFLGPLIIWIIKKEESPFVNDQGREALNFQISISIAYVTLGIFSFIAAWIPYIKVLVGCLSPLLFLALWVSSLVFAIIGGLTANKGLAYRYPFSLHLIK